MFRQDEISAFYQTYSDNFTKSVSLEEQLLEPVSKEEWISRLKNCACLQQKICNENQALLDKYFYSVQADPTLISDEEYDYILFCCRQMYYSDYPDPTFLLGITRILIPHYLAANDTESLLFLYICTGFSYMELARTGNQYAAESAVLYYKKVLSFRDEIDTFDLPQSRDYIFIAYANLLRSGINCAGVTPEEGYALWQELCSIRSQKKFCQYDKINPRIPLLCDQAIDSFLSYQTVIDIDDTYADSEVFSFLNEMAKERLQNLLAERHSLDLCPCTLVFHNYYILAKEGSISWENAWHTLHAYYFKQKERADGPLEPDPMIFSCNLPLRLIDCLKHTSFSEKCKKPYYENYRNLIIQYLLNQPGNSNSYAQNNALQILSFHPLILGTFQNSVEKINFIFDLVVSKHLSTLTHSVMVSYLAEAIGNQIFEKKPEILYMPKSGISLNTILKHRSETIDFFVRSALFHDIGKNGMIPIINTQHRKLTDFEFQIIKTHPEKGSEYLSSDKDFRLFHFVALGHHKSYDGTKGYPLEFNNVDCSCRFAIDLIHICDCLDAATDYLSRNYHKAKSFDTVMEELKAGRGTEYNPDIVNLILEEPELYQELKMLTEVNRENIYYDIYLTYVNKKQ